MRRSGIFVSDLMYSSQEVFYNFRMPIFFILSGVFIANSLQKKSYPAVLKDRTFTILYPYLVWAVILVSLEMLFSNVTNSKREWVDFTYIIIQPRAIDHLWYLFALFNTTLLYLFLSKIIRSFLIHGLLTLVLHWLTFTYLLKGESLISDAFYFYIYFFIGTILSPYLLSKRKSDMILNVNYLLWLLPLFLGGQYFWFKNSENIDKFYFLFIIINLIACYVIYILSHHFAEKKQLNWLSYLGKYSLYIYILHVPIAAIFRIIFIRNNMTDTPWLVLATCWFAGLLLPIVIIRGLKKFGILWFFSLKPKL